MATHARMADPKTPDDGDGPLKNGTASLEDSDDSSNSVLAKSRSPAAGQHGRDMDGFQDGGPPPNRPASASMEGGGYPQDQRSQPQHYPQQNFNNNSNPDGEFRPQPDYEMGGNSYRGFEQQHGGPGNDVTTNSKMYQQQYGNSMRPPFSPRGPQRAPYPGGSRFVSGPSLSQQTGPTPTLNQLLQAPNSLQRYQHNSYDYPNQKGDGAQHYPGPPNNTWGGGRYPQQHSPMYRNQQGDPSLKRSYPAQMSSPGAQQQPYPQQQYHPYSNTPPSQGGPRHNYPQQGGQQQQYPSGQGPPMSTSGGGYEGPRPQVGPYVASGPPQQQQTAAPSQQPPTQQHLAPPTQPPQQQQPPPPQDEESGSSSSEAPPAAPPLRTTPPGVSPHRPAPSPSGSPSMSPALGQPPNIPMPPRPSSTQSENSGQAPQAPAAQGYNQQMAPPGMYGNKMHPNMMGSSHMPPYSPSSHYPQGGYHRAPGSLQMHGGYSGSGQPQNTSYPGPRSNYVAPPSAAGYNSQPYPSSTTAAGYSGSMMPPPNQYPKAASMPPPAAAAGAQAAAQAAVIAAAASSGSARQSPMYLRQHLQQKMYNSYGAQEGPPTTSSSSSQPPCDFASTSTIGLPPTTVTQSISSPVPSTVTVSSPSDMMQSPRNSMGPGPPLMDEGSQASNASASSSLPEERVETPKPLKQQLVSHPPTPNALPSPGAASMSSFHDDFESVSSPSWPRTPASPVINNQPYDHHPIKRPDGMLKLYDMSEDPDRRLFLDKLILYQEERGTPLSQCPTISKQPLDLYRLYLAAKERGGFVEVMKGKMWKEIAGLVGIGASSSAAYTLRKQYIKHLLPFECKFDRGGIDPVPLISSLESNSRKKNAKNTGGPMMDGYPGPYPGSYPPNTGPHPGMIPGGDYPGHHPAYPEAMHHPSSSMTNHSEGAMDPFSDDMQGAPSQYPQRHNSEGGYASYPPPSGSSMPTYPSGGTPASFGYSGGGGPEPQQPPYSEQYPPGGEAGGGYAGGRVPPDPYAPPPGGYPPNRTVGPANSSQYPPYQNPCGDQERFGEPQNTAPSPMIRPSTPNSSVIGPSSQPDPSSYPTPHRYPSQPITTREAMPPQPIGAYQSSRPPLGPSQYPSSQPYQAQTDNYSRGPDFQPQMSRLQSTLIQRLLPKNQSSQSYPPSQQPQQQQGGMYGGSQSMPPPNKVAPPGSIPGAPLYPTRGDQMYQMGPKRHPDYAKGHDQYHHYPQQASSQAPYSDRSQYPYRPTHGMPPQSAGPPPPPSPQQGWPRDGRSYVSSQQAPYPPSQRDTWDMSRHGDSPSQPAPWQRYGGPQSEPYPHHMGGPKMMSRSFGPNKMTPHGGPPPQYTPPGQQQRREVTFPPDTVEGVSPLITKRRRLLAKDVSPVDPWRLMMALKSGLLGESTWALDALAVLVHDDASVLYFGLGHLQGLLEVLMDHYRRTLNLVFSDLAGDTEVGCCATQGRNGREKKWYELDGDDDEQKADVLPVAPPILDTSGERMTLLDTPNYTYRTRCRKTVRTQEEQALFLFDPDRRWDVHEGFISGSSHWQHGGGEHTGYIQTHFEDSEKRVRFVRLLQDSKDDSVKDGPAKDRLSKEESVKDRPRNGGLKREGGSDTEEDESPPNNAGSPKPSGEKCEENDRISKDPCRKEESTDSVNNNSTAKNMETTENCKRTCDSESEKTDNGSGDFPKIRAASPSRKRRSPDDPEDESYTRDEPSLCTMTEAQDSLSRRCIAASSILRNLSFVPGNDTEMSKHSGFLLVLGRLLLLHHVHAPRRPPQRHYDREEEGEGGPSGQGDSCSSLSGEREWWWDALHLIRENTLVTLANISGQLDLAPFPEEISFPILDGLMHWVTCPSSHARDPLPTQPPHSVLSPQRLSLEALSKLSVLESNVDLMMATPPWRRTDRLFSLLSKWLGRNEDQVLREFSVVLLSNLSQADSAVARAIALQGACIPLLITFVEQAEQSALQVANAQGINALRENPELMGTTLDMVRRAAGTLRCLARVPANRTLFLQHQGRLLALVMSQILDQGVASIVADVLYECSRGEEGGSSGLTDDT